ncbi:MAG: fibronectin type III domain-containing protein, partial [Desulfosarcina sp.]|nr:fibronectin type III domain-containing protein [Desulfobacterales bacterium]
MQTFQRRYQLVWVAFMAVFLSTVAMAQAAGDKYRLVWTDDPATTMTIGWCQTSGNAIGVKYGTGSTLTTASTETAITTRTYDNTRHPEGVPLVSEFVTLTGLTPDTIYYFCTVDSEGDNTIYRFKTAPDAPAPFTFISGGDSRTNQEPRQWCNQ